MTETSAFNEVCDQLCRAEENLYAIRVELAALLGDPQNPDWMPALTNGNKADAECLQKAYELTKF